LAGADWQTTSLRIALFTQQALPLTADLFTAFAGEAPDRQEDRPKQGVRRQVGIIDGAELSANITPIMIDFTLAPPPVTAEALMGDLSSLSTGEVKSELAKFERRTLSWLPKWEIATTRVSLVIQARAAASSKKAAYEILRSNLKSVRVQPDEMNDLLFRVNWKAKTSTVPEGYYNRLTSWSTVRFMATAQSGPGSPEVSFGEHHFAQVDIDINTPAERFEPLPRDKMGTIYKELFQLAVNVVEAGEGP
jgi:hypothetical protein